MTTSRSTRRPWVIVLVLALVVTVLVALRPAETTMAGWSDQLDVEVPPLATGGTAVVITPAGADRASVAVTGDVAGTWRPASVTVGIDGQLLTGAELAGSRVEYRLADQAGQCATGGSPRYAAAPSGSGTAFPVTGDERLGGTRTLCLGFVPSDQVRVQQGGRTLTLTTTVDGVAGQTTWTAAGDWAATHAMPAGSDGATLACLDGGGNRVTLTWQGWDGLGLDARGWSLQVDRDGTWHELLSAAAAPGSMEMQRRHVTSLPDAVHDVRLVATLADGVAVTSGTTAIDTRQGLSCA